MSGAVTSEQIGAVRHRMQPDMSALTFDMGDLRLGTDMVEAHLGRSVIAISGANGRLDRVSDRVGRIERRPDLTDAH